MIVGCYDLHLYCDFPDGEWKHRAKEPGQFTGRTFSAAKRDAVRHGWHFHSDGKRVICPTCARNGRKLPKAT